MPTSFDPNRLKLADGEDLSGTLIGYRCQECGVHMFGPAIFCQACTSSQLQPVELGATGTLYSYTMVRVPPPGWPGPVPYILGEIELPEGPHVLAEITDCAEGDLRIGMSLRLALLPVEANGSGEAVIVYKWRPSPKTTSEAGEGV